MIQYARRPKRTKLQLEALALGVVAHGAVSVTVRRPDRNWNWELASINPVPSGHGLAQAPTSNPAASVRLRSRGLGVQDPEARDLTAIANVT